MDLKEYIQIVRKNARLFWGIVGVVIGASFAYFYLQPVYYNTSLLINITRQGKQVTDSYRYDDFYRLQADERFSDTVAEWLRSPRIAADVYSEAGINPASFSLKKLSRSFSVERRSSQIVAASFSSASPLEAKKISSGIVKIISQNTEKLNQNQKEENWFEILSEEPVIAKNVPEYKIIFLAAALMGFFLAFWIVLLKHYFE